MTKIHRTPRQNVIMTEHRGDNRFFARTLRNLLDASALFEQTRNFPSGFPFPVFGVNALCLKGREMYCNMQAMAPLECGNALERLVLRMRLLRSEYELFVIQKEVTK